MILDKSYNETLLKLKNLIAQKRYEIGRIVNKEVIGLYWEFGKEIYNRQKNKKWGKSVVEKLSLDIQTEYEGISGFSPSNLWRMSKFYETYKDADEKLVSLIREISWTQNMRIFDKCKDNLEREYYIRMTIRENWSVRLLIDKIEQNAYLKWGLKQTNFDKVLPVSITEKTEGVLRDEYKWGFLDLKENYSEKELEEEIIKNIRKFLLEMGGDFAFIANQYPVRVNDKEFFIDILLFHRKLKCLVAIELKTNEFQAEYLGKMALYLGALEEQEMAKGENPPIGIIVCHEKDRDLVKLTLSYVTKPMGVSTYKTFEETDRLPEEMRKYLPPTSELKRRLLLLELKDEESTIE